MNEYLSSSDHNADTAQDVHAAARWLSTQLCQDNSNSNNSSGGVNEIVRAAFGRAVGWLASHTIDVVDLLDWNVLPSPAKPGVLAAVQTLCSAVDGITKLK